MNDSFKNEWKCSASFLFTAIELLVAKNFKVTYFSIFSFQNHEVEEHVGHHPSKFSQKTGKFQGEMYFDVEAFIIFDLYVNTL